jgi:hypothetical protein
VFVVTGVSGLVVTALALASPACRRLSAAYAAGMPDAIAPRRAGNLRDQTASRPA